MTGGATQVGGRGGGYLTQNDYIDLVNYASDRFITIVPEIGMPGHTNAALSSYGELNESGEPTNPCTGTVVGFSSLWIGAEITDQFVVDVLTEVADMTPGQWIHTGGDEAFATEPEDYAAFIAQVHGVVDDLGKTMIGWDEIADSDIEPGFVGQYWKDAERARELVQAGGSIVSSQAEHAYLDMKCNFDIGIGHTWVGLIDTQTAYGWDPIPEGVDPANVLGVEAAMWTEMVRTWDDVQFLMFPRLPGHAEIGWSSAEGRSWGEYRSRLAMHGERMHALDIGFYRSPLVDWTRDDVGVADD